MPLRCSQGPQYPSPQPKRIEQRSARMLRGIHKASSQLARQSIMAGVMGVLVISFAIWGIGDIFRGFGAQFGRQGRRHRNLHRAVPPVLQRPAAAARPPARPRDHAGSGARARPRPADRRPVDRRDRARRAGAATGGSASSDAEIAQRITNDPNFRGANGQFDRDRFEQLIRNAGFTEARYVAEQRRVLLRRQIAQTISGDLHVPTDHAGGGQPVPEREAQHRLCGARTSAGRRHPAADAGSAEQIFRRAQGHCSARRNTARSRCCR